MAGRFARRGIRVIVADDFPIVRDGIVRVLDEDGIDVVAQTGNGREALDLTLELGPDVLLLDYHMQDIDALEILRRLRAERPEIKVILMAASDDPAPLLSAIAGGANSYLSKRASVIELREAIKSTHLGGSVITPALTRHLLDELTARSRGEASTTRPQIGEQDVAMLRLVAAGKTDVEIAKALLMSPRTVQNHLTRIRVKSGLNRRAELTRWAVEHAFV